MAFSAFSVSSMVVLAALLGCRSSSEPDLPPDLELRLNDLQVIGSHNSYKLAIDPSLFSLYEQDRPEVARSLDYSHATLTEQLGLGLRGLELDVFWDPEGGRYEKPGGIARVAEAGLSPGPVFDPAGVMASPGLKVLHVQDLDFRSSCLTLAACLGELREWSVAHSGHLPILVTVNAKDGVIDRPGFVEPLPFDDAALEALDEEVLRGLGRERLITPDDVRGKRASLEEVIRTDGWPLLDDARGRFLFVLDEGGDKLARYVAGHPGLRGRIFFVNAEPGTPEAAFLILNDPIALGDEIRRRVGEGYLVRTRADADTLEARSGDTTRRAAAFLSGAHVVSTDYYRSDPRFGTAYQVALPEGGYAHCNPVTASPGCRLE